jgi:hypothetical protein
MTRRHAASTLAAMSYRIRNAAAALVLSAAAATTAALVSTDGGQAQQPTGQTLVLKNSAMKLADVDMPPLVRSERSPETPGDEVIATSKVAGAASGSRYLFCAAAKQGASIEKALYSCQVTYTLANGTITAAGVGRIGASGPITVAVTGGTGAYAGARGTLTSQSGSDTLTLP